MSVIMATKKEVLYVELPASLKKRFADLADANGRKLVAEAIRAVRAYVECEDPVVANAASSREKKVVLYVELPAELKARFAERAELNGRKLVAEAIRAIRWYVDREASDA